MRVGSLVGPLLAQSLPPTVRRAVAPRIPLVLGVVVSAVAESPKLRVAPLVPAAVGLPSPLSVLRRNRPLDPPALSIEEAPEFRSTRLTTSLWLPPLMRRVPPAILSAEKLWILLSLKTVLSRLSTPAEIVVSP